MSEPHSLQPGENAADTLLNALFGAEPGDEGETIVQLPAPASGTVIAYATIDEDVAIVVGAEAHAEHRRISPDQARALADQLYAAAEEVDPL